MIALTPRFGAREVREIRSRSIFEAGKLDPQNRDEAALAPFAVRIAPSSWRELSRLAESAAAELRGAEGALLEERRHWRRLGLSRSACRLLASARSPAPDAVRFSRFDFHPTETGWRVSEVNADVPGGFIEAGPVTRIVASYVPGLEPPADPAEALAGAVATRLRAGDVALVHATSYSDDQQVMRRLGEALAVRGVRAHSASPAHVRVDGLPRRCSLSTNGARIGAILRFFPGDWLTNLRAADRARWARLDGDVAQANPLSALLVQSKRLPIVAKALGIAMPTWDAILPCVTSLGWRRFAPGLLSEARVLKPAWGRVGEGVCLEGITQRSAARRSSWLARCSPRRWVLQERFVSRPVAPGVHVCFGVYVVDGRAAGVYGRVAPRPLIDGRAQDVAVLIDRGLDAREIPDVA